MLRILLDNGHGYDTPGKHSPVWADGTQFFEWKSNRELVKRIAKKLQADGIAYDIISPEDHDIGLSERCRRANSICAKYGKANCLYVSVHSNACTGKARGLSVYTSKGQTASDKYAEIFCTLGRQMWPTAKFYRDMSDGDSDMEENFYVLRNTICPAILTESFFFDNEEDCRYLMSEEGKESIAEWHYRAIKKCIELHAKM
jgi:N-acetylmuramoyl-L-alanine amidase